MHKHVKTSQHTKMCSALMKSTQISQETFKLAQWPANMQCWWHANWIAEQMIVREHFTIPPIPNNLCTTRETPVMISANVIANIKHTWFVSCKIYTYIYDVWFLYLSLIHCVYLVISLCGHLVDLIISQVRYFSPMDATYMLFKRVVC